MCGHQFARREAHRRLSDQLPHQFFRRPRKIFRAMPAFRRNRLLGMRERHRHRMGVLVRLDLMTLLARRALHTDRFVAFNHYFVHLSTPKTSIPGWRRKRLHPRVLLALYGARSALTTNEASIVQRD